MTDVMRRVHRIALIAATIAASWLGMQAVHELGHVLGARLTGGRVERVILNPLTISCTDLSENPHPFIVTWAGPIFGALLPLLAWAVADVWVAVFCGAKHGFAGLRRLLQYFAGFCLISNGLYISLGSFHHIGDCADLLHHGSPLWLLHLFGALTAPLGLFLWHKMGPSFGLATTNSHPSSATHTS
jgi:hypothetical protein